MKAAPERISKENAYTSTRNACKLCSPLGACLVYKGIRGCIPLIHGSQGCATYIRRYLISHFREPVDIASSNFSENSTVFGGNQNFNTGIDNIITSYNPEVIGIASTCLSETIGEDVPKLIFEYQKIKTNADHLPKFVSASTPSYNGTHSEGFYNTVYEVLKSFVKQASFSSLVNVLSGFISPEDIRYVKEILAEFGLTYVLFPDYSETLDNTTWKTYTRIPEGGTSFDAIQSMGSARASIEFGTIQGKHLHTGNFVTTKQKESAGEYLQNEFLIRNYNTPIPIGISLSDKFFHILEELSGMPTPEKYVYERGRLIDAYIDGHKQVFGKKAIVYGEEDFVISMITFLLEIGIKPVLAASGGKSKKLRTELEMYAENIPEDMVIADGWDFEQIKDKAEKLKPDIMLGNSKGYYISRSLGIPLVRVGFPVHDRIGAQRILHIGYRGTQQLFDKIVNAIIESKQENSNIGYKYM